MSGEGPKPGGPKFGRRSPSDQAEEAVVTFERATHGVRSGVEAVREARDTNQVEVWTEQRGKLDAAIAQAEQALERARGLAPDMGFETKRKFDNSIALLDEQKAAAEELGEAPAGFAPLEAEDALLAVFAAPIEGGAKVGYDRKQLALQQAFDELSVADRRTLALRLRRNRAADPISAAFRRLTAPRQQALLAYLDTAAKRDAQRREVELRAELALKRDKPHES